MILKVYSGFEHLGKDEKVQLQLMVRIIVLLLPLDRVRIDEQVEASTALCGYDVTNMLDVRVN